MKIFFLLTLLSTFFFNVQAQKKTIICGRIKSTQNFIVQIEEPLNGYYNLPYLDTLSKTQEMINGKDSIYRSIIINKPTFICIVFLKEDNYFINRSDILLLPGDSVNLHFNLEMDNSGWTEFHGSNAAGNEAFNKSYHLPYTKYEPRDIILSKLPANKKSFVQDMDDSIAASVKIFFDLKEQGAISLEFFKAMQLSFNILYYQGAIDLFTGNLRMKKELPKDERDTLLAAIETKIPIVNSNFNGLLNSLLYLDTYQNYLIYKKLHLNSILQLQVSDKKAVIDGKTYVIDKLLVPMLYIEDKRTQEDLWAMNLLEYFQIFRGMYDKSVIDQYCSIFPHSKWESLLRKQFIIHSGVSKIEYKLQSPIYFIDDTHHQFNNLNSLIKQLPKGKPIFIDCWATWCAPCVSAFSYNERIDSLLLKDKVTKLYISFDHPDNKKIWKKDIQKFCLGGYHIMANSNLILDLKKACGVPNPEKSQMGIPRYLIIDKHGIVAINDAASPHDFDILKDQLDKNTSAD